MKAVRMWGRRNATLLLAFFFFFPTTLPPRWPPAGPGGSADLSDGSPAICQREGNEARRWRGLLSLTALAVTPPALGTGSSGETKARGCSPRLLCQTVWDAGIVRGFLGLDTKGGSFSEWCSTQTEIEDQFFLQMALHTYLRFCDLTTHECLALQPCPGLVPPSFPSETTIPTF